MSSLPLPLPGKSLENEIEHVKVLGQTHSLEAVRGQPSPHLGTENTWEGCSRRLLFYFIIFFYFFHFSTFLNCALTGEGEQAEISPWCWDLTPASGTNYRNLLVR